MKICRKIILLVLTLSVLLVFSCKTNEKKSSAAQTNDELSKYDVLVDAYTKQCPVMLNEALRLDSLQYDKEKHTLIYNFTMINIKKSDLPGKTLDLTGAIMRDSILSGLKSQSVLDMFREDKLKLSLFFKDKEGSELFAFDFKHTEY